MSTKRSFQNETQHLHVLQWKAGGMSQAKKTQLQELLTTDNIDVFAVIEANLTEENLPYYQFPGYNMYLIPKFRQVASGFLTGVRVNLTSDFVILKEMCNTDDKSLRN